MSDRRLRVVIAVLAATGLAVAGYLTYIHYAAVEPLCAGGGGGCERVQSSSYSELAGVPVALLGAIGYALILASLFVSGDKGRLLGATLALVGFGFSAYLTWVELVEIDAICQWCVVSAVLMTSLAVVTAVRILIPDTPDISSGTGNDGRRA
jgi:uncharacterized membrane protein